MLKVSDLRAGYAGPEIVHGIDFEVDRGDVVALLGRNGMGKTTVLRAIIGILRNTSGSICLDGYELPQAAHVRAKTGIGWVADDRRVFDTLTVVDNLLAAIKTQPRAALKKDGVGSRLEYVYDIFPRLGERIRQPAGSLSGGEQQMLAMARALVQHPRVLLLDEPNEGLSPFYVENILESIRRVHDEGVGVLLVEHSIEVAFEVSSRIYVLERGDIIHESAAAGAQKTVEELLTIG